MSKPVFIHPEAAAAVVGGVLTLTGPEAKHAATVQRRTVGELVDLVDGLGNRASGHITAVESSGVDVTIDALSRDEDAPVVLVQALAKGGRDEQAVETATELGVTEVVPWAAQRCIVQWRDAKRDKGKAGWQAVTTAAAKQSRRAWVPVVHDVVNTSALAAMVRDATAAGDAVVVLHESADTPLTSMSFGDARQRVWFIVGPEGGVSDSEIDQLREAGATVALLGRHVLRASSAGPTAMAVLAALRKTW